MLDQRALSWRGDLAPGLERSAAGELRIGGIAAHALIATYGSPLVVIDLALLAHAVGEFVSACAPYDIEIAYAGKAMLNAALVKYLAPTPLAIDVCSLGELITAERAAFPAKRLRMHGCGKTDEEVRAVAMGRVGTTIVDGIEEIERLGNLARADKPAEILLRVNTGIEAQTHAYTRTAGEHSKFGISPDQLNAALTLTRRFPGLRVRGLHSHLGSNIFDLDAFGANVDVMVDLLAQGIAQGHQLDVLNVGGGFGVESAPDQPLPARIADVTSALAQRAKTRAILRKILPPKLGIEPGRALIARAGTTLYSVMAVKAHGTRNFAIIDGGLADNPRQALYNAYHHVIMASRPQGDAPRRYAVCGRSCESDEIGEATLAADLAAGDLLAMCTTGAYTFSMASNYNRFPKPAVVFLEGGAHRLVVRRERAEDVVAMDVLE